MRNRTLALATLASVALPTLMAAPSPGTTLVRQSARSDDGVTLELTVPAELLRAIRPMSRTATVLRPGQWARTHQVGGPDLPVLGIQVEVPATGPVGLEVLQERKQTYRGVSLPLVEAPVDPDDPQPPTAARIPPPGFLPGASVEVGPRLKVGEGHAVRVMFQPFRWNRATGELQVSTSLKVRLRFRKSPGERPRPTASLKVDAETRVTVPTRPAVDPGWLDPRPARLRVEVRQDGLYRINYEDLPLLKMGRPVLVPGSLVLSCQGREVPLRVVCASGRALGPGDYLEFYGKGLDTVFTDTNVYSLTWQGRPTRHLDVATAAPGAGAAVTTFRDTVHVEQNKAIWALVPGAPNVDWWFWESVLAPLTRTYAFTLPDGGTGTAHLKVTFQGYSAMATPDHHTKVSVNGTLVGDEFWTGQTVHVTEGDIPAGVLASGDNTLTLECPGDSGAAADQIWFNHFDVSWTRPIKATSDAVTFNVPASGPAVVTATGFTSPDLRIYDVTDPYAPRRLDGFTVSAQGGTYQASFSDDLSVARTYVATTAGAARKVASLDLWAPSGIRTSPYSGADYLVVTGRSMLSAVEPLLQVRRAQGLRSMAVAMEDIYGEFSDGIADPVALKRFLNFAHQNWVAPAPQYVFLLGDASYDYRNYLGTGKANVVPVHLCITEDLGLTPDDNWFITEDETDATPFMSIGRMPAKTAADAATVVTKLLHYEQSGVAPAGRSLLVADDTSPSFQITSEYMATLMPSALVPTKVYMSQQASTTAANAAILSAFNSGLYLSTYFGHGNQLIWTRNIFTASDVAKLTNAEQLPFVLSFDCLNGYYASPTVYALGEVLAMTPGKGSIATFAASGLGYIWEHEMLGGNLLKALFKTPGQRLGDVCTKGKVDAYFNGARVDVFRAYQLLSDPALVLKNLP